MNKKTMYSVVAATFFVVMLISGVAYAATPGALDIGRYDSIVIGKQDVGGVTFFNGTIVNTTTRDGNDNPVTFGDNVRIDGRIWRGLNRGPGLDDNMPVIVDDELIVTGDLEVDGADIVTQINSKAVAGDVYNKSEVDAKIAEVDGGGSLDPVTGYVQVHGSGFASTASQDVSYDNLGITNNDAFGDGYRAPISLPQGATITGLKAVLTDDVTNDISVELQSCLITTTDIGETCSTHADVVSVGANDSSNAQILTDTTIDDATIANDSRFYYLSLFLPAGGQLHSVIVDYTVSTLY